MAVLPALAAGYNAMGHSAGDGIQRWRWDTALVMGYSVGGGIQRWRWDIVLAAVYKRAHHEGGVLNFNHIYK